jgi:predicted MPP superfamily phosphohydrolase
VEEGLSFVEGGRHLFVTGGVGTSIVPVRFHIPPEVVVLKLEGGGWPSEQRSEGADAV